MMLKKIKKIEIEMGEILNRCITLGHYETMLKTNLISVVLQVFFTTLALTDVIRMLPPNFGFRTAKSFQLHLKGFV